MAESKSAMSQSGSDNLGARDEYLRYACGKLTGPGASLALDADRLVSECWEAIRDANEFPPKLFLLWVTPAFKGDTSSSPPDATAGERSDEYQAIVAEVRRALAEKTQGDVPLIGCSVGACLFHDEFHDCGALLICLASKYVGARPALGRGARKDPAAAVRGLLGQLDFHARKASRRNQFLLVFAPGFASPPAGTDFDPTTYCAEEFFGELCRQTDRQLPLFGGVSSREGTRPAHESARQLDLFSKPKACNGDGSWAGGHQFLNDQVMTDDAVAVLITTELAFGLGFAETVEGTEQVLTIDNAPDERTIAGFAECAVSDVMPTERADCALCHETPEGRRMLIARRHGAVLKLRRNLRGASQLRVIHPRPPRLIESLRQFLQRCSTQLDVSKRHLVGLLAIVGRARWEHLRGSLDPHKDTYASLLGPVPRFGSILDGEIGTDDQGQPVFNNCSVSRLLLSNTVRTLEHHVLEALANLGGDDQTSLSPNQAMTRAVEMLQQLGYPGGMISLIEQSEGKEYLVARAATEGPWRDNVQPETIRPVDGDDILVLVERQKTPDFVREAATRRYVEKKVAKRAGIDSFIALPLIRKQKVLGILQIDFGDLRDIPALHPEHERFLKELASLLSLLVDRLIGMAELKVSRRLDDILSQCTRKTTFLAAVDHFVGSLRDMLQEIATADHGGEAFVSTHLRVARGASQDLWLAGGVGDFFETASRHRVSVPIHDATSASARAFRERVQIAVNDTERSESCRHHRDRLKGRPIAQSLQRIRSFVSIPLDAGGEQPLGVMDISVTVPWFFAQYLLRVLEDAAKRFPLLLDRIQKADEISFVEQARVDIVPTRISGESWTQEVRSAIDRVRENARAQILSCYVWDEERNRYVLRVAKGWRDASWDGVAWYGPGEGRFGCCIHNLKSEPVYGLVSADRADELGDQKYVREMFGYVPALYEFIALPIRFGQERLGGVLLHREFAAGEPTYRSGFRSIDSAVLQKVATNLSNALAATLQYELVNWQKHEAELLTEINAELAGQPSPGVETLVQRACVAVRQRYQLRRCQLYLATDGPTDAADCHLRLMGEDRSKPLRGGVSPQREPSSDNARVAYRTAKIRHTSRPGARDQSHPARVWIEQGIRETSIPLVVDGSCLGVLVMTWGTLQVPAINEPRRAIRQSAPQPPAAANGAAPRLPASIRRHYSDSHLVQLGGLIAGMIERAELQRQHLDTARTIAALRAHQGIGAVLAANLHALANGIWQFQMGLLTLRARDTDDATRQMTLAALAATSTELRRQLERARAFGKRVIERGVHVPFSPWSVARKTVDELTAAHANVSIRLEPPSPEDSPSLCSVQVLGDPDQIGECLRNLVHNAVRVSAACGPVLVRCSVDMDQERAHFRIDVQDSGPGLSQAAFREFVSGRSVKDMVQGSGMGLFLGRVFAELHGGTLELLEPAGRGATIQLSIPLKPWERTL